MCRSVLEMVNRDCYYELNWALGASSKVQLEQEASLGCWQWFRGTRPLLADWTLHPLMAHKPQSPCQRITDFSLYPLDRTRESL